MTGGKHRAGRTAAARTLRSPRRVAVTTMSRTALRGGGQVLMTAGLVVLLFVGYGLWWTGLTARHDQHVLIATLRQQWAHSQPTTDPPGSSQPASVTLGRDAPLGSGIAILRIPRLGKNYKFAVVEGTSTADLIEGPGHYPGTAMPGQVGNFAVAGHRTTYLHPFYDIDELKVGDAIVVETRSSWFTYRVQNVPGTAARHQEIVPPTDVSVAYPVPDQPDPTAVPTLSVLTLTSCNPRYSAAQRIVVHAVLSQQQPKQDGLPPALAGYPASTS
jgi:sortase A